MAELAANSSSPEARRGALALLAQEYGGARAAASGAPIAAVLALVRPLYDEDASVRVAAVTLLPSVTLRSHFCLSSSPWGDEF